MQKSTIDCDASRADAGLVVMTPICVACKSWTHLINLTQNREGHKTKKRTNTTGGPTKHSVLPPQQKNGTPEGLVIVLHAARVPTPHKKCMRHWATLQKTSSWTPVFSAAMFANSWGQRGAEPPAGLSGYPASPSDAHAKKSRSHGRGRVAPFCRANTAHPRPPVRTTYICRFPLFLLQSIPSHTVKNKLLCA